jgi:hypothetical protein
LFVGRFVGTKFDGMSTMVNVMTFNTTMFTFFNTWRCGLGCRFFPLFGFYFFVWRPPQVQHTTFWSCSIKKDGEGPNWPPLPPKILNQFVPQCGILLVMRHDPHDLWWVEVLSFLAPFGLSWTCVTTPITVLWKHH